MKVEKVNNCYCMEECKHQGEGFVIMYDDEETVLYLCEKCFTKLYVEVFEKVMKK